jgi:hypothetical protein
MNSIFIYRCLLTLNEDHPTNRILFEVRVSSFIRRKKPDKVGICQCGLRIEVSKDCIRDMYVKADRLS